MPNGSSNASINHGIADAFTNNRIISVIPVYNPAATSNAITYDIALASTYAVRLIYWNDTVINVARNGTTDAIHYFITIMYV